MDDDDSVVIGDTYTDDSEYKDDKIEDGFCMSLNVQKIAPNVIMNSQKNSANLSQTTLETEQDGFQHHQISSSFNNNHELSLTPIFPRNQHTTNPNSIPLQLPLPSNVSSTTSKNINFDLSSLPIINLCDNRDNINAHNNSTTDTLNHKNIMNTNTSKGKKCRKVSNYSTVNHAHFSKHKTSHTTERLFKCPKCNRTFTRKSNLTVHLDNHSGYRRFECTVCFKRFTKQSALSQHIKIHSGQNPDKCTYSGCDKSFVTLQQLILHNMDHTGMRPYVCECNKRFRAKSLLKKDMYTQC